MGNSVRSAVAELFRFRHIVKTFVVRQIKIRYRKFWLGYFWTVLEPLATMAALFFVVGGLLRARTENFSLYLISGLVPWSFFNNAVSSSTNTLISNAGIVKKIYFPREVLPLSSVLFQYFNFLLSLLVLLPFLAAFRMPLKPALLFLLPYSLLMMLILAAGFALICSSAAVFSRDVDYLVKFALRLLFFLTPLFYSIEERLSGDLAGIYFIVNPLAVIIMAFRSALMGISAPAPAYLGTAAATSLLLLFAGYRLFKRNENEVVKRL